MHSFASLLALAAPFLAYGAPLRRQTSSSTDILVLREYLSHIITYRMQNDTIILLSEFAEVLEQFESQFYSQALSTFQDSDFISAGFVDAQVPIEQFVSIQIDESSHASTLEVAIESLGASSISGCQFDFTSVLVDVSTMAATARVVENLGVSAYLGAASLISDPVLLTAAASIMTIEARHQTILNILTAGTAIPQAYDIAFTPSEVLAIASTFISGCDIGITANPTLSTTNTGSVQPGTQLSFASPALNSSTSTAGFFCQMLVGGAPSSISLPFDNCVVPTGINGPVAIFITVDDQALINNVRDRAEIDIIAGPTMAFIDTDPQLLSQLALAGSQSDVASTSTETISPNQASSILSSAAAASTIATSTDTSAAASTTDMSSASATDSASASSTDSASASAPTSGTSNDASASSTSVVQSAGGPNLYTGPSADGSVTVNGWTTS
ncbi:hypothetical protein A0H81_08226 [Grifola frondosa]|uniref:Protein rds1 n=1 Tax=Grifola frondosa TaxID=5627 RepID=A0A1C7M645_GRIFR|nr:hypothetical protein A0H81_08226 [Grifola frondosa]